MGFKTEKCCEMDHRWDTARARVAKWVIGGILQGRGLSGCLNKGQFRSRFIDPLPLKYKKLRSMATLDSILEIS